VNKSQVRLAYLIVGLIAALLVELSLPAGKLVACGDGTLPEVAPKIALERLESTWTSSGGLGYDTSFSRPLLFPVILLDYGLSKIRLAPIAINHSWLFIILILQALLTVRLIRELFPRVQSVPAIVFGGAASILNPFMLLSMHGIYESSAISVAVFPGIAASLLRYINTRRATALIEFAIWTGVAATTINIAVTAVASIFLVALVGPVAFSGSERFRTKFARILPIIFIYAGIHMIWYVPSFHWIANSLHQFSTDQQKYSIDTFNVTSRFTSFGGAARLVGSYLFFNPVGVHPFIPEGVEYLSNPFLILCSLCLPFIATSSLLFVRLYGYRVVAIAVTTLIAIFLSTGLHGTLFWLFMHSEVFAAFRNFFDKFEWMVVVGYCLLASVTLDAVSRWPRRKSIAIVAAAFVSLAIAAYPILAGRLFWPQCFVTIPSRYYALGQWLDQHPGRTLQMPVAPAGFDTYDWGYVGSGINLNLTIAPIVSRYYDAVSAGNGLVNDTLQNYRTTVGEKSVARLLGMVDIQHVVYDPTIDVGYFNTFYSAKMPFALDGMRLVRTFGPIRVYDVDKAFLAGNVYAAKHIVVGARDLVEAGKLASSLPVDGRVTFVPAGDTGRLQGIAMALVEHGADVSRHLATLRHESFIWLRPSMVHIQTTKINGEGVFLDDGDRTIAATGAAQTVTYGFHRPVQFSIGGGSPDFLAIIKKKLSLCADPRSTVEMDLAVPTIPLRKKTGIIVLSYSSHNVRLLSMRITGSDQPRRDIFVPLTAGNGRAQWARLFRISTTTRRLILTFSATAGSEGGCAYFAPAFIGVAAQNNRWTLLANNGSYRLTPPYFASDPRALYLGVTSLRPIHSLAAPMMESYDYRKYGVWSDPQLTQTRNSSYTVGASITRSRFKQQSLIRSYGAPAMITAYFDHLLPGAEYKCTFSLLHKNGVVPRAAIYAKAVFLAGRTMQETAQPRSVAIFFREPGNSSDAIVNFITGENSSGYTANVVGRPELTLVDSAPQLVAVANWRNASTPRMLSFKWRNPTSLAIRVRRAPPAFLLVFNEAYSNGWKITTPPKIRADHVFVNFFENGWVIHGGGDFTLKLRYDNEEYARIGALLGIGFVLLGFVLRRGLQGVTTSRRRAPGALQESSTTLFGVTRRKRRNS